MNFYSAFLTEKKERAGLEMLAEHAKRMIRMAGEDAVALGTDFDGFERKDLPEKLEGAERIELVWDAFQKAGITSRQTRKDRLWESFPCDRGRMWKNISILKKVRKNAGKKKIQ